MNAIEAAFDQICTEARQAKSAYVALMCDVPFYGGPEEGGWWGSDQHVVKYQQFDTIELAEIAADAVKMLAEKLTNEAKRNESKQCLRECEWLEARGLDDNFLPEPNGPEKYYVIVSDTLPEGKQGCRHYE